MTIKDSQDFAAFITDNRFKQLLTIEALSCASGVSPTTIFHCENVRSTKYGPSLGTIIRIANALGYEITITKKENKK